jgi:hypothetical protein
MKFIKEMLTIASTYAMGLASVSAGFYLMFQAWNIIWWQFLIILSAFVLGVVLIVTAVGEMAK